MVLAATLWWFASRATGIVATLLIVASLAGGFFFSARNTGHRRTPAWWLDLHGWLGGLALAVTGAHLVSAYLDSHSGVGLVDLFIPGASPLPITWGVLAAYGLTAVVFSSWPKKRLPRPWWRVVHLSSLAATAGAGVHAYQSGSDRVRVVFQAGLVVLAAPALYATFVRLLGVVLRRSTPLDPRPS